MLIELCHGGEFAAFMMGPMSPQMPWAAWREYEQARKAVAEHIAQARTNDPHGAA